MGCGFPSAPTSESIDPSASASIGLSEYTSITRHVAATGAQIKACLDAALEAKRLA